MSVWIKQFMIELSVILNRQNKELEEEEYKMGRHCWYCKMKLETNREHFVIVDTSMPHPIEGSVTDEMMPLNVQIFCDGTCIRSYYEALGW